MRNLIIAAISIVILAGLSMAGTMVQDGNSNPIQQFTPWAYRMYSSTKAPITIGTNSKTGYRVKSSAAAKIYLKAGDFEYWPLPQDTVHESGILPGSADIVFTVTSSATKTKLYFQYQ